MSKWKILVSAPYLQPVVENYRQQFESRNAELLIPKVKERLTEDELLKVVGDIDGVIAGDDHFTANVLEKATPRLKVISKWGTGIDEFDQQACKRLGVVIRNTPDAFTNPVADSAMGYVLNFARNLSRMDQQIKAGVWNKIPGKALNETTLGIIGLGNIGSAVAKRAHAFGMKLMAHDIRDIPKNATKKMHVKMVGFEELLRNSDFISLHCDLNSTNRHLLDAGAFEKMKKDAFVINLARGGLIKEDSLIQALTLKKIAGAALDVFEQEPLPKDSPLKSMPNVMLAPHNSNSSPSAWLKVHENSINNLFAELEAKV